MNDLTKRFSLEHLISGSKSLPSVPSPLQTARSTAFEEAFQALSDPVVQILAQSPDRSIQMFELLDKTSVTFPGMRIESLQEVVRQLERNNRVIVVNQDRHGNHLLKLV